MRILLYGETGISWGWIGLWSTSSIRRHVSARNYMILQALACKLCATISGREREGVISTSVHASVMTRRLKMRNRWFTERPEVANSANIYICTFFERGGGGWGEGSSAFTWIFARLDGSVHWRGLLCADTSGAQEAAMDASDDSSSFKEYEPPSPSAIGVATRCEMPAQPLVGNL